MKRYDMQVGRIKHDCGESFLANMVEVAEGRYAEYEEANARIAELTAEVARYKAAMQSIVDDYKQAFHTDWTTAANYADTARNALKGVV